MAFSKVLRVVAGLTFAVSLGNGYYDIDDSILFKISFDEAYVSGIKLGSETTMEQKHAPEPPPATFTDLKDTVDGEGTEQVTIVTKRKEKYVCHLPNTKLRSSDNEDIYKGATPLEMLRTLFRSNTCYFRLEPFWNYELCHGRFLRQFHEERDGQIVIKKIEYILGKYDEETLEEDIAALRNQVDEGKVKKPKKKRLDNIDIPYYEIVMRDGTICDLTGSPRVARVQYLCNPSGGHEIYSVKERSTCEYEIVVLSPILCAHPDYKPETVQEHVVSCLPADGKGGRMPMDLILQENENTGMWPNKKIFEGEFSHGDEAGTVRITVKQVGTHRGLDSAESPVEEEDSEDSHSRGSSNERSTESRSHFVPVSDLDVVRDFLLGKHCLYGGSGWWKYEFCYGRYVNQYHEEGKSRVSEINLGRFDKSEHKKWIDKNPSKLPARFIEQRKTVSHYYGGGDHCDIIDRPRSVEVKLKCRKSESLSAVSLYLLEPKPCQYVLGVESQIICDILPRADPFGLMELSSSDFDDSKPEPKDGEEGRLREFHEKLSESNEQEGSGTRDPQPVEESYKGSKVEVESEGANVEDVTMEREFSRSELEAYLDDLLGFMKHDKDYDKFKDFLIEDKKELLIVQLNLRLRLLKDSDTLVAEALFKDFIGKALEEYLTHFAESDAKTEL